MSAVVALLLLLHHERQRSLIVPGIRLWREIQIWLGRRLRRPLRRAGPEARGGGAARAGGRLRCGRLNGGGGRRRGRDPLDGRRADLLRPAMERRGKIALE